MSKFAVEIDFNHYKSKIGYLIEADDRYKAEGIAQRHFLNTHPDEVIISTHVLELNESLIINPNPSARTSKGEIN